MGTIADKLTYLNATKAAIKAAIVNKGVSVSDTDTFRSYADKIVSIETSSQPQLNAPTISITDSTLTITNPTSNGDFVTAYKVYTEYGYVATVTETAVDLTTIITEGGTYDVFVTCVGTNFEDSIASNAVTYKVLYTYTITTALSHVIADSTNPKTIKENASASLMFTAASGYKLPETVTVTGCTYTWEPSTGVLDISNPTSNVAISISAIAVYQITTTLTGCTGASSNPSTIEQGGTATLTFTANTGYALPDTITVEGATHTWNKSTGTLTLSDPTGNVVITIVAIYITPQLATPQNVTANGTTVSWDEVENATSYDILADGVSIGTVENETEDPLAGTWVFNDGFIDNLDEKYVNFTSFNTDFISIKRLWSMGPSGPGTIPEPSINHMWYRTTNDSLTTVFQGEFNGPITWTNEAYKTITITSKLSEVTDGDTLLAWLQTYATKQ